MRRCARQLFGRGSTGRRNPAAQADTLGIDRERIAIGGQSAGGGLAAALVQRIHDEGGTQPAAQWLFCPMLDDRTSPGIGTDAVDH